MSDAGYRRPPKDKQFQKGKSGNPAGRPRGSRSLTTAVLAAANERVTIVENGRRKTISKLDAAVKQLANKAAAGNERAITMLCALMQGSDVREQSESTFVFEDDRIVMARLAKRFAKELAADPKDPTEAGSP